jgi:hypothetical protein
VRRRDEGTVRGRLARLSGRERRLLVRSFVTVPLALVGLRVAGYDRTRRAIGRISGDGHRRTPPTGADLDRRITGTVDVVRIASTRVAPRSTCLAQSIVLWALLRRQGIDSEIVIGVKKSDLPLDAHAWVERQGRPLNETPEVVATFLPLR